MSDNLSNEQIAQKTKQEYYKKPTNYEGESFTLPSKGWFYPEENPLSSGQIELKYPTAREEDILTSRNLITKGLAIDKFLQSIIMSDIDYNTLLLGDKNGIMYAARIMAYGAKYSGEIKCPSCLELNKNIDIDLSEVSAKPIDFEKFPKGTQEFDFTLPSSNKDIKFKFLTHFDEKRIDDELKAMKKKVLMDVEITTRLKHVIVEVDGSRQKSDISKFVEDTRTIDSRAFRSYLNEISPDVDSRFYFTCQECGYEEEVDIPLGIQFFWPTGRV